MLYCADNNACGAICFAVDLFGRLSRISTRYSRLTGRLPEVIRRSSDADVACVVELLHQAFHDVVEIWRCKKSIVYWKVSRCREWQLTTYSQALVSSSCVVSNVARGDTVWYKNLPYNRDVENTLTNVARWNLGIEYFLILHTMNDSKLAVSLTFWELTGIQPFDCRRVAKLRHANRHAWRVWRGMRGRVINQPTSQIYMYET